MFARACASLRFVCAGLVIAACTTEPSVASVAGAYAMSRNSNADTLRLNSDGTWHRAFYGPSGFASDSGRWILSRDHRTVILRGFPKRWAFVHDLMGDTTGGRVLNVPGTVGLTIARSWRGKARLNWYPEFGWTFDRVSITR